MKGEQQLGVDLGTTWTAAAIHDGNALTPLKLGAAGAAMPSVVAISEGTVVAGDAAVRVGRDATTAVAREFKRRLGDSTPIVLNGTPYGPEALTGHLLAHVVAAAATAGHESSRVALAHPATWGEFKLDLLREAGRLAGVADVRLVPEPIAAAGHYARLGRLNSGDAVAVYDFGGGTFDAAVVRIGTDGPELLGTAEGLDRLGGVDLDQAVLAHVDGALDGALRGMDRDNPDVRRAALQLRADCIAAKEALSADTETTIPVRFPSLTTEVRMTRVEFEAAIRPRVADTLNALDRALASASLTAGDLAGVVLVGGSSRIPVVAEQVAAHTGRPTLVDADPKLSVASGAAEPDLRTSTTVPAAPATVTREHQTMSDSSRSTPPPPPPAPGEGAGSTGTGPAAGAPGKPAAPGTPGAAGAGSRVPPRTAPSERRTAVGNAPKEQSGMSTAGKIAAGVAAAGAATAAGLLWHEDVTDALGITGEDEAAPDEAAPDDAAAVDPAADSMDAFDSVAPSGGGGGGGGGGAATFAPPRPRQRRIADDDDAATAEFAARAARAGAADSDVAVSPEFLAVREQLQQRLDDWQPPEGADPEEAAALRDRLEGLLERYRPDAGQSTDDAIAELRDEFDVRIENFTQDIRLDTLTDAQNDIESVPPEFEAQRQQLLERLENWTPPEGADAEEAAALREELGELISRARPVPGQSVEDAVADLQQRFEGEVNDFVTDQKLDELVEEQQQEDAEAGAPAGDATDAFEVRRAELIRDLENWEPQPGIDPAAAEARRTELLQQVRQAQPVAGQSIEATFPPVHSDPLLFNTGVAGPIGGGEPPAATTDDAPAEEMPAGDTALPEPADTDESAGPDDGVEPDPRVTMPNPAAAEAGLHSADGLPDGAMNLTGDAATSGLVDDFDAMTGIGEQAPDHADVLDDLGAGIVEGEMSAEVMPQDDLLTDDVLGDLQVADAMTSTPDLTAGVATAPTFEDPAMDDLGLDLELADAALDDFSMDQVADPVTFEEPDFTAVDNDFETDFAPVDDDLDTAVVDDTSSTTDDDLGLG